MKGKNYSFRQFKNQEQLEIFKYRRMKKGEYTLIFGAILLITGAILKISHSFEDWNDWIFRVGLILGLISLVLKLKK